MGTAMHGGQYVMSVINVSVCGTALGDCAEIVQLTCDPLHYLTRVEMWGVAVSKFRG